MKPKRTIVVGSGAGGLSLALLLARAGRPVTLIESQPEIGGYLRRFTRGGIRFDTGFHFSGGYTNIMSMILHVLGLDDAGRANPIPNRIILENTGNDLTIPAGSGFRGAETVMCDCFGKDAPALHRLFDTIDAIWKDTPMCDLRDLTPLKIDISPGDLQSVTEFYQSIGLGPIAGGAAGSFAMCHGSLLSEAAMSFHARVGYAIFDDLARPVGGGDPIIAGFKREAARLGIELRTGTTLLPFSEMNADGECTTVCLSDGSAIEADQVFFTIHPLAVCELLPEKARTASLCRRIRRFRDSTSFFCSYYVIDEGTPVTPGLVSYFTSHDLDAILTGADGAYSTGYLLEREADLQGKMRSVIAAFRTMQPGSPDWAPPTRALRREDAAYREFKEKMTADIASDLVKIYPEFKGHLRPAAAGSPLTCRDYDPPTGSAYGVRNVCAFSRLFGRLPVRNFFIAGQSALVPGVMGTMLCSFSVFRQAVGEETYCRLIRESGIC